MLRFCSFRANIYRRCAVQDERRDRFWMIASLM